MSQTPESPLAVNDGTARTLHFKSPGFTAPARAKLSESSKNAKRQWVDDGAALVRDKKTGAYQLAGATRKVAGADKWMVRLSADGGRGDCPPTWAHEDALLDGDEEAGTEYEVIFGWLRGSFRSPDGVWEASPKEPIVEAGAMTGVVYDAWRAGGGSRQMVDLRSTVDAFLKKFPPQPVPTGPAWKSVRLRPPSGERDDDDLLGAGAPEGADRLATLLGLTLWKDDEGEGHTLSLPVARALLDGWHNFEWGRDRAPGDGPDGAPSDDAARACIDKVCADLAALPDLASMKSAVAEAACMFGADTPYHAGCVLGYAREACGSPPAAGAAAAAQAPAHPAKRAGEPTAAAPAKQRKGNGAQGINAEMVEDEHDDDGDLSDSGDSEEDSDDEDDGADRSRPRSRVEGSSPGQQTAASDAQATTDWEGSSVGAGRGPAGTPKPGAALRAITPPTLTPLAAATIFFKGAVLLEAAGVEAVPPAEDREPGEEHGLVIRYAKALTRLRSLFDTDFMPKRPATVDELYALREEAYELAVQRAQGGGAARDRGDRPVADAQGGPEVKRTDGLAGTEKYVAVGIAVADSLRGHAPQLESATRSDGDVGNGVRGAPDNVRDDLRRALLSNGKVHAPGAPKNAAHLPSVVTSMRDQLERELAARIQSAAAGDPTRRWHVTDQTAHGLAASLMEGTAEVTQFAKANATMRGSNAPAKESADELIGAWSLISLGLSYIATDVLGRADPGIEQVAITIDPQKHAVPVALKDAKDYVARIIGEWNSGLRRFRDGGGAPSIAGAVREFSAHVSFSSFAAVAVARVKEELGDRRGNPGGRAIDVRDDGGGAPRGDRAPLTAAGKKAKNRERRERKRQQKRAESPGKPPPEDGDGGDAGKHVGLHICWPNKPKLSQDSWIAAQKAARQHFPGHCVPWMMFPRGCNRGGACTFKHEKPGDFAAKIADVFKE